MASINCTQIKKNNWRVEIVFGTENGKRKRTTKQGFRTKKAAQSYAREILSNADKGYIVDKNNSINFGEFLMDWYTNYKKHSISISTQGNYLSRINTHILPNLGKYKLCDLTNFIVQNFYNDMLNKKLKPSTIKKTMEILKSCLRYAKKQKLILDCPTDIDTVKCLKPEILFWNESETSYYLNQIKDKYLYLPVFIDILTGLRVGELCGLKWKNINLDEGYIKVTHQVIQDRINKELIFTSILKTNTAYRTITIPQILVNYLKKIKEKNHASPSDFVVLSHDGTMCNPRNLSMNFVRDIKKYSDKSNDNIAPYMRLKQISFHGLRHTHATILLYHNENIKVLSERLGHADVSTTLNTYTHITNDMKNNTANLLDSIFK